MIRQPQSIIACASRLFVSLGVVRHTNFLYRFECGPEMRRCMLVLLHVCFILRCCCSIQGIARTDRMTQQSQEQQQEEKRSHARTIEEAFGQTDQEKPAEGCQQRGGEHVAAPHSCREPPERDQNRDSQGQRAYPSLPEKN